MKATGIVRKVDQLGRIVLAKELRQTLKINEKDPMEIYVTGEDVILRRYAPDCIFCGNAENLVSHNDKNICESCRAELADKIS